jgi:TonB family protein
MERQEYDGAGLSETDRGCTMSDSWKECEGQVIDGEFPLLQHLGGSDHSVVFLTQRGKNRSEKAAIKFVQAEAGQGEIQLSRWKQAAQISHPNLIRLFESGRCQLAGMDLLYVVMEYAPENLAQFLPERALSPAETRDLLEPFLETLVHLHGRGLVHGRIRPGNILAIDDQLKLSSDSLSRMGEPRPAPAKPDAYTAPESSATGSPAGDVWSLGATLVETLTQHVPEGKEPEELGVSDAVPQPFLDIARHSLRRDPESRWTVAEISARLNPPAIPPALKVSAAAAIPDPIKPAAFKPLGGAAASSEAESKAAAPAKPAASIDPLSVPLSQVPPLLGSKHRALENQAVAGKNTSYRSYYIVVAVLVALTLGAMLAIPRLRDRQSDADTASVPSLPTTQPEAPRTPSRAETPPKPQPKSPQHAAVQPHASSLQDSLRTTSEKQFLKKEPPTDRSGAPRAAGTSSASVGANPVASTPAKTPPVEPAGAVTPGQVLNQVLPEVSAKSRSTIHGTVRVVVKVHVNASGTVTGAETASSPSKFFSDAAVQAAKRWDFTPTKIADQPVPSEWLLRFDFTPSDTKVLPTQTTPLRSPGA